MRVGNSQETEDVYITTNIEGREVHRILDQSCTLWNKAGIFDPSKRWLFVSTGG